MMEGGPTVHTSLLCILEEVASLVKRWYSVVWVKKDDVGEYTVSDDDGLITAIADRMRDSDMEAEERQDPENENLVKELSNPEQTLKRSALLRREPWRLEDLAAVAVEDLVTVEEELRSSNWKQRQKAINEELKSIEDNGNIVKNCTASWKSQDAVQYGL